MSAPDNNHNNNHDDNSLVDAYNQMMDIKSGARNNGQTAAMKGIMAMVSPEEAKAIADWLSTL